MSKVKKKSITDLLQAKRKPTVAEIEQITEQIHVEETPSVSDLAETMRTVQKAAKPTVADDDERVKRMSVVAPLGLYMKARNKATLQDLSLMAYILQLIEADTQND